MMSSSTSFIVHPSRYYIGMKKKKYFARKGDVLPMDLIVTDNIDGNVIPNMDIEMTIYNRYWERKGYNWKEMEIEVGKGRFNSKKEPIPVKYSKIFEYYGDRCDFTVVVQDQTLDTVLVKIDVRMTNLRLTDSQSCGVLVEIRFAQRAELRFPVRTHKCGTGRFQVIGAVMGTKFADAVEKDLPIFTPSTSEVFASYGEMDGDSVTIQSVIAPKDVYNQFGGYIIYSSSKSHRCIFVFAKLSVRLCDK